MEANFARNKFYHSEGTFLSPEKIPRSDMAISTRGASRLHNECQGVFRWVEDLDTAFC